MTRKVVLYIKENNLHDVCLAGDAFRCTEFVKNDTKVGYKSSTKFRNLDGNVLVYSLL